MTACLLLDDRRLLVVHATRGALALAGIPAAEVTQPAEEPAPDPGMPELPQPAEPNVPAAPQEPATPADPTPQPEIPQPDEPDAEPQADPPPVDAV
jgi:hypothetical protein